MSEDISEKSETNNDDKSKFQDSTDVTGLSVKTDEEFAIESTTSQTSQIDSTVDENAGSTFCSTKGNCSSTSANDSVSHNPLETSNDIDSGSTNEECYVKGNGLLTSEQGVSTTFKIHTLLTDLFRLQLQIHDEDRMEVPIEFQCIEEFVHEVSYSPVSAKNHIINVLWRGNHVEGSPFIVKITGAP